MCSFISGTYLLFYSISWVSAFAKCLFRLQNCVSILIVLGVRLWFDTRLSTELHFLASALMQKSRMFSRLERRGNLRDKVT